MAHEDAGPPPGEEVIAANQKEAGRSAAMANRVARRHAARRPLEDVLLREQTISAGCGVPSVDPMTCAWLGRPSSPPVVVEHPELPGVADSATGDELETIAHRMLENAAAMSEHAAQLKRDGLVPQSPEQKCRRAEWTVGGRSGPKPPASKEWVLIDEHTRPQEIAEAEAYCDRLHREASRLEREGRRCLRIARAQQLAEHAERDQEHAEWLELRTRRQPLPSRERVRMRRPCDPASLLRRAGGRERRPAVRHAARRAAGIRSGTDSGDDGPGDPPSKSERPRPLGFAVARVLNDARPGARYTFAVLSAEARGEESGR